MQINQLIHFVTIVEKQSFTTAAAELHIAQPSLSASIKRLENEFGFTLLDRSERNLKLTLEGETFFQEARKFVKHHELIEQSARQLRENGPNTISIGLIESVKSWLPDIVESYRKTHQDVRMRIIHSLSEQEIKNSFENYDVNLAITNQYIVNADIISVPLYEEPLVIALPIDNAFKTNENITLHKLADIPLIISHDGYQTRTEILNTFKKIGITPNIAYEIERFELTSDFVKKGLGVSILPERYAQTMDQESIEIRPINDLNFARMVYVSFDKTRFISPLTKDFINLVLDYFDRGNIEDYLN